MEGNLLYSKSADLNINLDLKNTFTAIFILVFGQTSGQHSLAKLTHKANHHTFFRRCRMILINFKL